MSRTSLLPAAFAVALAAAGVSAETHGQMPAGQRVRVVKSDPAAPPVVGALVDTGESLTIAGQDGQTVAIHRASISRLDVSQGKKGHARWGVLAGLVAGTVVLFAATGSEGKPCDFGACVILPVGGAIAGGLVGLVIRTERWKAVPAESLRVSVAPVPRGARVSLSIGF